MIYIKGKLYDNGDSVAIIYDNNYHKGLAELITSEIENSCKNTKN